VEQKGTGFGGENKSEKLKKGGNTSKLDEDYQSCSKS
tara:strand:- start:1 stop:111 length:111 start_codon:yes stop_codon:yes gene_type:complete